MARTRTSGRFVASLVVLVVSIALLTSRHSNLDMILSSIIASQVQQGVPVSSPPLTQAGADNIFDLFNHHTNTKPNNHIGPLQRCPYEVNNTTNTIRLPYQILNISLNPRDTPADPKSRYFNPTLIPLPPYSPHPYLLLSRLVTTGLHQESHICLASLCLPRKPAPHPQNLPIDAHLCSDSDVAALGHLGGIRCVTKPERLNIPPTPALRCEGAWAAFPDIPGFHDPRVFWSGKGEPLVIINSASQYACVGLWVVDLRAVYPEMRDLLDRKGKYTRLETKRGDEVMGVPAKMSYPHLTELTRNPRASRGAVEKNWVLFFPRAEESWVQYDLVGHAGRRDEEKAQTLYVDMDLEVTSGNSSHGLHRNLTVATFTMNDTSPRQSLQNQSGVFNSHTEVFRTDFGMIAKLDQPDEKQEKRCVSSRSWKDPSPVLIPSRSFAKVIGSGYTTHNLTSPDELPCLSSADLLDNLGNEGHWHQGSNSLRLVLCSRHDMACLEDSNEDTLINQGKVIHFAILHRKFSNDLDLPMRYERHIMVWEARRPFRMLGISRHPILFAGERAQPWTDAENGLHGSEDAGRLAGVYFTYTPSLAWSWRKDGMMEDIEGANGRLGTGYLGDDVIVGVGMDDVAQGFVRVKVDSLISCLRLCPGFGSTA